MFVTKRKNRSLSQLTAHSTDLDIFTQSLVTYLQAGQYKLLKAYRAIATAERKEVLSNKIAAAQRSSLEPESILANTVKELGLVFPQCRCLLYCLSPGDIEVQIKYEAVPDSMASLRGETWLTADNPLFITAQAQQASLIIDDISNNAYLNHNPVLKDKILRAGIKSWLMVSIRYQGTLLGMLELHQVANRDFQWQPEDISLIEAVATSAGAALTQASSYTNLLELNVQLEAVEQIQNNLIAIVGHELRTPLTTIKICLESLASEPDMAANLKQTMLDTALGDTERLEQLIQNFLTLSRLEAGKAYQNIESLTLDYALNLALRQIQSTSRIKQLPEIKLELSPELPQVLADIDGLVDVLTKLLDNACKFTPVDGKVVVQAQIAKVVENHKTERERHRELLEVIISDTGRGISSELLEIIFNRFAQSENFLRRTAGGTGLGLVICRQIIQEMGGKIWATSDGENKGSQFHFTLPIES
ncbi:MAG: ATP-binding protein [Cyanobacteria bacterium P01_G01_bin.67]